MHSRGRGIYHRHNSHNALFNCIPPSSSLLRPNAIAASSAFSFFSLSTFCSLKSFILICRSYKTLPFLPSCSSIINDFPHFLSFPLARFSHRRNVETSICMICCRLHRLEEARARTSTIPHPPTPSTHTTSRSRPFR